jgi:receptor protein-tyrosine kinase
MLIPKASHLVERVAERLLRSGALDDSAAQLLQPGSAPVPPDPASDTADAVPGSALFAAPPDAAALPGLPSAGDQGGRALSPQAAGSPVLPSPVLPSPAILGQARVLGQARGQAAVLDHFTEPTGYATPSGPRGGGWVDPAAGSLQGPTSIDAVSLERAGMVDWSRTRTRISEEFRLVQRQILRSAFGPSAEPGFSNLLLVTSARPGEGKSFMATNLAGSIARQGDHHVLLVDADSKRDSICYSLGLAQSRGLLDLASNPKLDPAPLIVKTPIERLSILPVGRERERSAELFSIKEMTRLIQSLGRRYADRLLILDAPPCLSTSDPAVLAQVVGQILFVVEADRTQRDEIEASLDLIQACPTITMVLNKQQISSRYTFGAYSSYYSS